MGGNIFLISFSIIIGALLLFSNLKEYKEYRARIDIELNRKKYQCYDFGKIVRVLYICFAIVGAVFAIIGILHKDYTTVSIGIVTAFLFVGQTILTKEKFVMYYDDEAFLSNGERVTYKAIKEVRELKILPFAFKRIITLNGKEYRVSNGCLKIIDDQKAQRIVRKKEAKKK